MENNLQKILLVVGTLIILALIAVVIFQQKATNEIRSQLVPVKQSSQPASSAGQNYNSSLANVIKNFSGEIKAISENSLTVEAQLADFSKPKNPGKLKSGQPQQLSAEDFETLAKTFKVLVDEKTILGVKKLADFKVGDKISVVSRESIYDNSEITAVSVSDAIPLK